MPHTFAMDLKAWFEDDADRIRHNLHRYFAGVDGDMFTGRWFESWREDTDPNRFEAADLLAVEALSVQVPPEAAVALVSDTANRYHELLARIPVDVPLWEASHEDIQTGSPADLLHRELRGLHGVDWVRAGKLLAAKRPQLLPVYDQKVKDLLNPNGGTFWETLQDLLVDEDTRRIIETTCAGAPAQVTLLRRIDVALWMHATQDMAAADPTSSPAASMPARR